MRRCAWCHEPMDDKTRRRKHAATCSNRCRKALNRQMRCSGGSNSIQGRSVTPGDVPYSEPPRPSETGSYGAWLSDERFRAQLSHHEEATRPLTQDEKVLLDRQRRNVGVLLPELRDKLLDRAAELRRREIAETHVDEPLKPENPFDPSSQGSLARRAMQSRAINRPVDPHAYILRPGQPGPPSMGRRTRVHHRAMVTRALVVNIHPRSTFALLGRWNCAQAVAWPGEYGRGGDTPCGLG
jgi:hypothetical protein